LSRLPYELRLALRRLRKSPGFTALVAGSLALAIGANTAVFALVNGVLFLRLPFPDAGRLVRLWEERPDRGWSRFGVSAPAFADWREQLRSLDSLAAYSRGSVNVAGPDRPQRVPVVEATADVFRVLGLPPRLGRGFVRDEEAAGRERVAVIAFDFWRDTFASDPAAVGRTIALDGAAHVVIGVLPPEASAAFDGAQVWRPLVIGVDDRRGARWLEAIGRLRPETSVPAARAELAALAARHALAYPDTNTGWTAALLPLREARAESARPLLVALWAAAGLVLLITCANVAGLLLARGAEREADLAVRAALGARPGRLALSIVTESLLLALLGGAGGALLAVAGRGLLARVAGTPLPAAAAALDGRVLAFTVLATLVTGLAFSLPAAARAGGARLESVLRGTGRGAPRPRLRARRVLVGVELSVAVVLLSATGLLLRSVRALLEVSPGFQPAGVLTLRVAPPQSSPRAGQSEEEFVRSYLAERERMAGFYDRLLERVRRLPSVQSAGAVNRLPLTGSWWSIAYAPEGAPPPAPGEKPSASGRVVTAGYFEALRIPLRAGRLLAESDTAAAPPVVVISESLARHAWPGQDALGRRLVVDEGPAARVVGVVGDVRMSGLDAEAPEVVYVPFAQAMFGLFPDWGLDVVVRTTGDPLALAARVRDEVAAADPGLPVFAVRSLEDIVAASFGRRTAARNVLAAFAGMAVLLAALGLYGVVSQSARQRTRELGVRVALGAQRADICRMILGEGLALALIGGAAGLVAAAASGRVLATLLFGVRPADPATLLAAAAVLAALAAAASLAPALRASRADPVAALRDDR
jgi:putative ABC transport system permease protein